jgi:cytochrome c biogenesis protein CcmG, thiol:disulfide interchange protein DsbE
VLRSWGRVHREATDDCPAAPRDAARLGGAMRGGHRWRRRLLIAFAAAAGTALVGSSIVVATLAGSPGRGDRQATALGGTSTGAPAVAPPSARFVRRSLKDSPSRLAALHRQGSRLLGDDLPARLAALRGHPVVLNAWASWCGPCRDELPLMSRAAARFGRRVAFLGADVDDSAADPHRLVAVNHLSYPSYRVSAAAIRDLTPIVGFPTTIYLDRKGHMVFSHQGQYSTAAELAADVRRYALGGGARPAG